MTNLVSQRYSNAQIRRCLYWSLLVILVLIYFLVINHKVSSALPYPTHIDEKHRLRIASKILTTGNFNPGYFHKPTLPSYLTAVGLATGFIKAAKNGKIRKIKELGSVSYPYYKHPEIVKVAKQLFVSFATIAVLLTAYASYKAFRFHSLLFLPALLIPFSEVFTSKSYSYINVNILGSFFIALSLSYIFYNLRQTGVIKKALIPGLLCALTISSKYNFLGIYLPFLLAIFFYERRHFISRSLLLIFTSVIATVMLNPYFILNLPKFLNDTAYQVNHYMFRGHRGFEGTPGPSQFNYYINNMIDEFGISAFLFSLFGLLYMFKINYKKTLIFISFPLFMLLLMSASKANFLRNLTPVYMLWPVFISMGLLACYKLLAAILNNKTSLTRRWQTTLASTISIILLSLTLPFATLADLLNSQPDSRNLVTQWFIQEPFNKQDITLIVANDLAMDTRTLAAHVNVIIIKRKQLNLDYFREFLFKDSYYFLLPVYGLDKRFPGKKRLSAMQQQLTRIIASGRLQPIKIFGERKVLLNYHKTVARGNPKFYLAKYIDDHESNKN